MDESDPRQRLHAWVRGVVQGVFFRASTREEALRLGVSGWVRNLPDGRVELVAEGPAHAVEALLVWARRGPPGARVDDVEVRAEEVRGEAPGFEVWR